MAHQSSLPSTQLSLLLAELHLFQWLMRYTGLIFSICTNFCKSSFTDASKELLQFGVDPKTILVNKNFPALRAFVWVLCSMDSLMSY